MIKIWIKDVIYITKASTGRLGYPGFSLKLKNVYEITCVSMRYKFYKWSILNHWISRKNGNVKKVQILNVN